MSILSFFTSLTKICTPLSKTKSKNFLSANGHCTITTRQWKKKDQDSQTVASGGSRVGGAPGTSAPPSRPKFLHFHAVFGRNLGNWSNSRLARPPPPWEILDPSLVAETLEEGSKKHKTFS